MNPTYTTNSPSSFPYPSITFNNSNLAVLRITSEGRMIIGEGLSTEEATQQAAKMLVDAFEEQIQKMVDARAAAELVTMNVPQREKAEADTARMDWLEKEALEDWRIRSINRASIDKAMKEASK
jgi:Glu-tRNA(Gln) amidotransferase subunit E-like FAD-binding protein